MPILAEQSKPPARRSTPRQSTTASQAAKEAAEASITDKRADALDGLWQMLSVVAIMRGMYADASALSTMTHPISVEVSRLAANDEKIAKLVDYLAAGGPYTKLFSVCLPLTLQLAANHRLVNATSVAQFGVTPPELLHKKMELQVAQQVAALQKEIDALMADEKQNAA